MKPKIFTIGHSVHPIEHFLDLLEKHQIKTLVDVRTIPRSRHVPHFNQDSLRQALAEVEINYLHLPELGGLRKPRKDSENLGWKNSSFRGFADYMQTEKFEAGFAGLISTARKGGPVAILCAEVLPWRCHRSLIADTLVTSGLDVFHIDGRGNLSLHQLNPMARIKDGRVYYPYLLEKPPG